MIDDALLEQCKQGSAPAFRTLYYRTMPRVRAWVTRFLGPGAQVADVVQEVFIQVHRSVGAFRGDAAFGTWLYRLTLNVATSHLRRTDKGEPRRDLATRAHESAEAGQARGPDEEARLVARDDLRRVYEVLDTLSHDKRAAFVLYELEGRSLQDIAEITQSPIPTVAARLRRARLALVEAFGRPAVGRRAGTSEESA